MIRTLDTIRRTMQLNCVIDSYLINTSLGATAHRRAMTGRNHSLLKIPSVLFMSGVKNACSRSTPDRDSVAAMRYEVWRQARPL